MGENSKIEWTNHTFNPWMGCTPISPGCANCYAQHLMDRRMGKVRWGSGQPRLRTSPAYWRKPKRWNQGVPGQRVFCASLADWLDEEVPIEWLADLLGLIYDTPNLDWLLLTKRPQNWPSRIQAARRTGRCALDWLLRWQRGEAPTNVWVGVSAENQERWNERLSWLHQIPARLRFVSVEPMLGPIELVGPRPGWIIVGGESGPKARPMNPGWAQSLCDECREAQVPFFFKQWGGIDKAAAGRLLDGRTWDDIPLCPPY